jgi:cation diffusion facilitator CzcD-associated flavoprotein CzcO
MASVAVVGGGFGGVAALVMLRRAGYDDVTVFERSDRIGGVWHDNRYPGAACDVPSHLYEFSFAPNPRWSRRYAPQSEIQAYLEDVVRSHGAGDRIRLGTEVRGARWDEDRRGWLLETSAGTHEADVLVTACGQLSVPKVPSIPGLESFEGPAFHTARWREDVDVSGKRVAVVGTGCSAIQVVPAIQPVVEHLDVYQRSPGWTFPRMDFEYSPRAKRMFERFPVVQRLDRASILAFHELGALAMTSQPWLRVPFRAIGRRQINKAITDPSLRRKVTPADDVGCKRVMLTDDWYPALAQPNVELVVDRIASVTPTGVLTENGVERPADALVLATGFKTHGFVAPMEVIGAGGRALADEWDEVARAYLGLSVPGFPNMFLLYGPNTNGGTGSVIYTIEAGVRHVISALRSLDRARATRIEVRREAADAFDRELRQALSQTVWHTGCTSWYLDERGNDPNQWPWRWGQYRRRTSAVTAEAYEVAGRLEPPRIESRHGRALA